MTTEDQTPPEGFNLDAEQSRAEEASQVGIVTRDAPEEFSGENFDEEVGVEDDSTVEDVDDDTPLEDI